MTEILLVANVPSGNTIRLAQAVAQGVVAADVDGLALTQRSPLDATADDVQRCDGILIGTTENFGYMSGLIKDFFERIYYPCLEQTRGLPYGLYIKGGLDGEGAKTSVERIITGLGWNAIDEPLVLKGDFQPDFLSQCEELGMRMAAGLDAGIY